MYNKKQLTSLFNFARCCKDMPSYGLQGTLMYLRRLAKKHQRYCEDYCNVEGFDPQRIEDAENKLYDYIRSIKGLPIDIETQRDPRGATVKMSVSDNSAVYDVTDLLW